MGLRSQTNQLFHQQYDLHCQHRQTTTECSGWHHTGTICSCFFNIYKYINVHCSWAWLLLAIDNFGTKCTLSHYTTDPSSANLFAPAICQLSHAKLCYIWLWQGPWFPVQPLQWQLFFSTIPIKIKVRFFMHVCHNCISIVCGTFGF